MSGTYDGFVKELMSGISYMYGDECRALCQGKEAFYVLHWHGKDYSIGNTHWILKIRSALKSVAKMALIHVV